MLPPKLDNRIMYKQYLKARYKIYEIFASNIVGILIAILHDRYIFLPQEVLIYKVSFSKIQKTSLCS